MKKYIIVLVVFAVCLLPVLAEAKTVVTFCPDQGIVTIQVGNIEYVSKIKTPEKLEMVRVWKQEDMLLFDLTATEVDYSRSYENAPKKGKEMSALEVAQKWAQFLKKFKDVRKDIEVVVY